MWNKLSVLNNNYFGRKINGMTFKCNVLYYKQFDRYEAIFTFSCLHINYLPGHITSLPYLTTHNTSSQNKPLFTSVNRTVQSDTQDITTCIKKDSCFSSVNFTEIMQKQDKQLPSFCPFYVGSHIWITEPKQTTVCQLR